MSRQTVRCAATLLVVSVILVIGSNAHALDISWINGSGGNFSTVSNWSDIPLLPDRAPGSSDVAHFGLSSAPPFQRVYTVSFSTDPTNQAFVVEDDVVTFDLNGHVYLTTSANPITIGTPSNFSGSLTITDGNVGATANSTLSLGAGDAGFLTVTTGGLLAGTAMDIAMGGTGGGTLTVNNGGDVLVDAVLIGNSAFTDPLSSVLVTGAGSALAGSTMTVGRSGGGSLRVSAGGAVESTSGVMADLAASGGLAIIEHAGSRWSISGDLSVGKSGNAVYLSPAAATLTPTTLSSESIRDPSAKSGSMVSVRPGQTRARFSSAVLRRVPARSPLSTEARLTRKAGCP